MPRKEEEEEGRGKKNCITFSIVYPNKVQVHWVLKNVFFLNTRRKDRKLKSQNKEGILMWPIRPQNEENIQEKIHLYDYIYLNKENFAQEKC